MQKIGVIGAGVIGSGVAQSIAQNDFWVILVDINQQILDKAKEVIYNNIRFNAFFDPDKKELDAENIMNRIVFTTSYDVLSDCDFIVENVNEYWETKEKVYAILNDICSSNCIFLANTSCISITKIASVTSRPDRVIGAHFMNPVPHKKTIEIIKGQHTSEQTIKEVNKLLQQLGKDTIIVNDFPGFVSNRISHLFINEAAFVAQDQVASPEDIDAIFKKCFEHKLGPLETADLIGIDTVVASLDILYNSYQDSKYRCCPLLRKMAEAGFLGRKSGQGFYKYE